MNAYKVWVYEMGYMLELAESPLEAKLSYWTNFMPAHEMFKAGAGIHCHLIEKNVETNNISEGDYPLTASIL